MEQGGSLCVKADLVDFVGGEASPAKYCTVKSVILLKDIDPSTEEGRALHAADVDGDGQLTPGEVIAAIKALYVERRSLFRIAGFLAFNLLLVVGVAFGLVWVVVDMQKDYFVTKSVMHDKKTGAPLQVASSDLHLSDEGVLMQRNSSMGDQPVMVAEARYTTTELNSDWSNSDLMDVKTISSSFGQGNQSIFYSANVDGLARFQVDEQTSAILFQTSFGQIVLEGALLVPVAMYRNGTYANLTLEGILEKSSSFISGRRSDIPSVEVIYVPPPTLRIKALKRPSWGMVTMPPRVPPRPYSK